MINGLKVELKHAYGLLKCISFKNEEIKFVKNKI